MTETIQRAARAICINNGEDPDAADTPYEIRGWRLYRSDVATVIETLLDPSEEAVEAAALAIWREREIGFPPRVRRFHPDEMDRESGAWRACVREARACIHAYHMTILGRDKC